MTPLWRGQASGQTEGALVVPERQEERKEGEGEGEGVA